MYIVPEYKIYLFDLKTQEQKPVSRIIVVNFRMKKSLKIPKGISESVNRRTDNTMTKRKRTNNHIQNTTQKTTDGVTRNPLKTGLSAGAPVV